MGEAVEGLVASGVDGTNIAPVILGGIDSDGNVRPILVDLDGTVQTTAAMTPTLAAVLAIGADANGVEITNGATPLASSSLATKGYVDTGDAVAIDSDGYFHTSKVAAPADGSLSAGEVKLWFDDTNGAAKLMIKGKSADGTVVTGSVTLT